MIENISILPVPDRAAYERLGLVAAVTEELPWEDFYKDKAAIDAQRRYFMAEMAEGHLVNPNLRPTPTERDRAQADDLLAELAAIEEGLPETVTDEDARALYKERVEEQTAYVSMTIAAFEGDMDRFREENNKIYGEPDPVIFGASADWFVNEAEEALAAEKASGKPRLEVVIAALEVIDALTPSRGHRELLIPDEAIFQEVRARSIAPGGFIHTLHHNEVDVVIPEGIITADNGGDELLKKMARNIGVEPKVTDSGGWSVTPKDGYNRPSDFRMPGQEFDETTTHESRHRRESALAQFNRFRLPATGVAGYERGNEGRAVYTEALTHKTLESFTKTGRWQEIVGRYLAVSLCRGLGGEEMIDFAHTDDLLRSAMIVFESQQTNHGTIDEIIKLADKHAWDITEPVHIGTDGTGEGGGWQRPGIYLAGFLDTAEAEAMYRGIIEVGDRGKISLVRQAQMGRLTTLSVVDRHDLEHTRRDTDTPHHPDDDRANV